MQSWTAFVFDMGFFMNKLSGIYKITNPKNKIYIGQSINIKSRFACYKAVKCKRQVKLYNSFKKYGVENHKFEILHYCHPEKLNELEAYYIELFQSFNNKNGLNLKSGGYNSSYSNESKRKMSEARIGKKASMQTIIKLRESHKGHKGWNKGLKHSDETKLKMRKNHKGMLGKKMTDEHKSKISKANKGKIFSEEHRRKLGEIHKGNKNTLGKHWKLSKETKMKISKASKGRIFSEETRMKLSEAGKRDWIIRKSKQL